MEVPEWLEALFPSLSAAIEKTSGVVENVAEEVSKVSGLGDYDFASEDQEDRNLLVKLSDAYAALYAMRDDCLQNEIPSWLGFASKQIERTYQQNVALLSSVVGAARTGDMSGIVPQAENLLQQISPRGLVARCDSIARKHELLLRKKALFAKGERRYQRKVSHRQ